MAKNNHVYTVYHSLDDKGAFDRPEPQSEPDSIQGKYWQEHTEYPKFLHSKGRPSVIVTTASEEADVRQAWTEADALLAQAAQVHSENAEQITKADLMAKAKKLGIKIDGRWTIAKLAYLIEETEQANEAKTA